MKVSSPGGMNLDVHAARTRRTDTLETQCRRTVALSVQNPLGVELSAQNLGAETAKKRTITK